MISEYPLSWPKGKARSPKRKLGAFRRSISDSRGVINYELGMMKASEVIISCNMMTTKSPPPQDPGVAAWFLYKGRLRVIAIDDYGSVTYNTAAIAASLEALRTLERHGGIEVFDQAMDGFVADALPAKGGSTATAAVMWWEVLGVAETAPLSVCEAAYRALAKSAHPDQGGKRGAMEDLNNAIQQAREQKK